MIKSCDKIQDWKNPRLQNVFQKMEKNADKSLAWIYDPSTSAPKEEDYLLGKAVDANFERGTLGQINAVEYGK